MLTSLVRFCVKEAPLVVLLAIGVIALGWYSYRTVPIDDPSDAQVAVVPDSELEGAVSLEAYCPTLGQLLREGPMTLEWAYAPVVARTDDQPLRGRVSLRAAE